ncbi:hypothetical protein BASA50_005218 [Batrachochytrium salamandrivorans]|uniref:Uncharacterized protein n=1 Tax=Batrachochytrium salamandrivorans TaxID=1357716 RepID=A0ABQ8FG50_9FUNG|nr:hypothetical protein BASA62_004585 [Batrachochytrium salamandrivorans]KAH6593919.1 hypothetical protein BASA61_004138 [Batrachochytrium salamandrivorans]KAH6596178.1 hypothetical protein BASA50_005218 [Batrachochytrium salamandrivorans]
MRFMFDSDGQAVRIHRIHNDSTLVQPQPISIETPAVEDSLECPAALLTCSASTSPLATEFLSIPKDTRLIKLLVLVDPIESAQILEISLCARRIDTLVRMERERVMQENIVNGTLEATRLVSTTTMDATLSQHIKQPELAVAIPTLIQMQEQLKFQHRLYLREIYKYIHMILDIRKQLTVSVTKYQALIDRSSDTKQRTMFCAVRTVMEELCNRIGALFMDSPYKATLSWCDILCALDFIPMLQIRRARMRSLDPDELGYPQKDDLKQDRHPLVHIHLRKEPYEIMRTPQHSSSSILGTLDTNTDSALVKLPLSPSITSQPTTKLKSFSLEADDTPCKRTTQLSESSPIIAHISTYSRVAVDAHTLTSQADLQFPTSIMSQSDSDELVSRHPKHATILIDVSNTTISK